MLLVPQKVVTLQRSSETPMHSATSPHLIKAAVRQKDVIAQYLITSSNYVFKQRKKTRNL